MWIAALLVAAFLAATIAWHVFEHFWNRRLFGHWHDGHFAENIRAQKARRFLEQNPEVLPIDVRPPKSFSKAHLPGAINVPFASSSLDPSPLASADRTTPILVYCDGGYRSRKALPHLKKLGFQSIYHLHRGIMSWKLQKGSLAPSLDSDTT